MASKVSKITFGILKPDCILRNLEDQLFGEMTIRDFKIIKRKRKVFDEKDVYFLYVHCKDEDFFHGLLKYMCHDSSVVFIAGLFDGRDAIDEMNELVGYYVPSVAAEGSLRKKYAITDFLPYNVIQTLEKSIWFLFWQFLYLKKN